MYKQQHRNVNRVQGLDSGFKIQLIIVNESELKLLPKAIEYLLFFCDLVAVQCWGTAVGRVENVARPMQAEQEGVKLQEDVTEHTSNIKAFCFPPS